MTSSIQSSSVHFAVLLKNTLRTRVRFSLGDVTRACLRVPAHLEFYGVRQFSQNHRVLERSRSRSHRPLWQHCSRPRTFDWLLLIYSFQFRSAFRAASASVTDTFLNSSRVFIVVGCRRLIIISLGLHVRVNTASR